MNLAYKEDWEATQERYRIWWAHGYFGRCALAVTAPRREPPDTSPPPPPQSPDQRWYDLDWNRRHMEYWLGRTCFGGEALPVWTAGYSGVSAIPAMLGCPTEADMETAWWSPILTDARTLDVRGLALDPGHPACQFTMRMLEWEVRESRGRALPSIGAFGGCGDTLAALRGTQQLLMDCLERPNAVRDAEEYLMDMWMDFYLRSYRVVAPGAEGSTCWFSLWSPGRFYAAQNDFSYNIGPDMFRAIFLPVIRRQTEFLEHCVYHVDGIEAFRHVDALCTLPRLQALQILPGAGKPSPLHYLDTLRKVQAAGKNLHITVAPEEVPEALRCLSARGLFIETWAATEDEAESLLQVAERLSVDRG